MQRDEIHMRIESQEVPQIVSFRYLGLIISKDGEVEEDVEQWIRAGWLKWILGSGVLCDKQIPTQLKGKCYKPAFRPAMTYTAELW